MEDTTTDIKKIRTLAWTLSLASANHSLDVPGEYIWAFPNSNNFYDVRSRYRSIFSSGNSIKDPEVIEYLQQCNINKYLLDPWSVNKFEEYFIPWLSAGKNYVLKNLECFKYIGFSAGTQESFLNFYLVNNKKRFRIFKGDYWWHMDIWSKIGLSWKYIEDDDIRVGDVCICSYPFALTGDKHPMFDYLLEQCNNKGVELLVDFIYLPNSINSVDIDLSADCIKEITFSLSKTFPVQTAKIAIRMRKEKPLDPMQMSNDENICNRLSAGLALELAKKFPIDFMVSKYKDQQQYWCKALNLKQTKVVHFGLGEDYTNFGRDITNAWCSPFNQQQNRYNLGMLFENESLLKKLNLYC